MQAGAGARAEDSRTKLRHARRLPPAPLPPRPPAPHPPAERQQLEVRQAGQLLLPLLPNVHKLHVLVAARRTHSQRLMQLLR